MDALVMLRLVPKLILTRGGVERLERELEELKHDGRRHVTERLRQALDAGGELTENTEYLEAQDEQARLEQRIRELESRLAHGEVVEETNGDGDGAVAVGARVRVRDRDGDAIAEHEIVGSGEGDPAVGKISHDSPIARAMIGRRAGDQVEAQTRAGVRRLEILRVE